MNSANKKIKLIYITSFTYRPKTSFYRKFKLFSEWSTGFIFVRSDEIIFNEEVANFRVYSVVRKGDSVLYRIKEVVQLCYLALKNLWGKEKIDIIVAYDPFFSGLCGLMLSFAFRAKLIIEINGDFQTLSLMKKSKLLNKNFLSRAIMKFLLSFTTRRVNSLKTINNNAKRYFSNKLPDKPSYCFMNYVKSTNLSKSTIVHGNYLLSVGYPFDLKGMDLIIKAFKAVSCKYPHMSLHIMGYCPDEEFGYYHELAADNPKIQLIKPGWSEDVAKQMSHCYAYVSASYFEAGGRTMFEAMFCKKPIIATKTNGALTYIHDNKNGLLCNIGIQEALSDKMDLLLSNPDWAKKLGMHGYAIAMKNYDENTYNNKYKQMLEEVLASKK